VLQLFEEMRSSNLKPDEMVLTTIISACGRARNLSYGEAIHDFIIENNFVLDTYLQSALLQAVAVWKWLKNCLLRSHLGT
jgi:pentatricopeptide repeat protein